MYNHNYIRDNQKNRLFNYGYLIVGLLIIIDQIIIYISSYDPQLSINITLVNSSNFSYSK